MRHSWRFVAAGLLGPVFLLISQPVWAQTPNDTYFGDQWYLSRIEAPLAWDTTTGSPDVVIAVLDTAFDLDHPDLKENLWRNTKEIAGNGIDDDGNGYMDDVNGWDFVHGESDVSVRQTSDNFQVSESHGTFISGIIGAETNNNLGYAGIVWNAKIMPLQILDENGGGTEAAATKAIDYAVKNGARVINLSFAGDTAGTGFTNAVRRAYEAGVVIVAALGNDGRDVNVEPVYPACLRSDDADWVIGVSATDEDDAETYFTNYGKNCADLSAPGVSIYGLTNSDGESALFGDQIAWSGTSAASPMVAGAAALLLARYPDLTPEEVRTAIKLSVDPIRETLSGRGALGVGRLNIAQALQVAASFSEGGPAPVIEDKEESPSDFVEDKNFTDLAHYSFVALGANKGSKPTVKLYRADGEEYAEFLAYNETFTGGIHVAVDDLNGDLVPEIVTGTGDGGGPHVRVFSPIGALISEFFAYDVNSRHGVEVATGDVDGDGEKDIVTVVGGGVSNDVVVWSEKGVEKSRFTVQGFAPGTLLTVAVGDVDDDWESEIIIAPKGGAPMIGVYNHDGSHLVDFVPYAQNMTAGMSLSLADFDGDAREEIVVAPRAPGAQHIRLFNKIGALYGEFFADAQSVTTGANVTTADVNFDGMQDVIVVPESGKGEIKIFSSKGNLLSIVGSSLVPENGASVGAW